jgi:hypothetical protein
MSLIVILAIGLVAGVVSGIIGTGSPKGDACDPDEARGVGGMALGALAGGQGVATASAGWRAHRCRAWGPAGRRLMHRPHLE